MDSVPHRTLYRSAILYPKDPLFVIPSHEQNENLVIDYSTAWNIALQYRDWIHQQALNFRVEMVRKLDDDVDKEVIVAFLAANSPQYLLSILGSMLCNTDSEIRLLPALLNARWGAQDINLALDQAGHTNRVKPILLLFTSGFSEVGQKASELLNKVDKMKCRYQMTRIIELPEILHTRNNVSYSFDSDVKNFDKRQNAVILFTSGTTKGSKGVLLSHQSLNLQAMAKLMPPCSFKKSYSMMATTSFFHIGGLSSSLAMIISGGKLVFFPTISFQRSSQDQLKFHPDLVRKYLRQGLVDMLVVVPAMLHVLLDDNGIDLVYPKTKLVLVGGQSLSFKQKRRVQQVFPNASIVQTYACSEAGSSITFADITKKCIESDDCEHSYGTYVGVAPAHIDVEIFDPKIINGLRKVPLGTVGVIGTRGCHIMNGYWPSRHHKESLLCLSHGWLKTGDLGFVDGRGRLFFCGRVSDTIRTGGETVFALEVEEAISASPYVKECAVFPIPNDRFGEIVCAAVVLTEQDKMNIPQPTTFVRDLCIKHHLARYKLPKQALLLQRLPRNFNGKIQKHLLTKMIANKGTLKQLSKL